MTEAGSQTTYLDLSGLKCPLPVLRTRKALRQIPPGALLKVTCTDPMAAIDIPHLVREEGDTLVFQERSANCLSFAIRRAAMRETTISGTVAENTRSTPH